MNQNSFLRRPTLHRGLAHAFTLVEILVSITILLIIMVVIFQLTATLGSVWTSSKGKISSFENARLAFSSLNATLGRATLNTYIDYVNVNGNVRTYRNPTSAASFVPTDFARASELHFIAGPANDVLSSTIPSPTAETNPGSAIFFQAPLGVTNAANFTGMNRIMNSVGIYIQYGQAPNGLFPSWLSDTTAANDYRFRLVEFIEPSENLRTYYSTSLPAYDKTWIKFASIVTNSTEAASSTKPRARILAEDVLLLIIRPRLSINDEIKAAVKLGVRYDPTNPGSILSPDYHYDSRAWMPSYPSSNGVKTTSDKKNPALLMCNQVPPVVDVAMVCADPQTLVRFGFKSPKPSIQIPTAENLFKESIKMDEDLNTFAQRLSEKKIHFHIMRSTVQIESSRWSNN